MFLGKKQGKLMFFLVKGTKFKRIFIPLRSICMIVLKVGYKRVG